MTKLTDIDHLEEKLERRNGQIRMLCKRNVGIKDGISELIVQLKSIGKGKYITTDYLIEELTKIRETW